MVIKSFEGGGGIVNFIVSGSRRHKVGIYSVACGTKLDDIAAQVTDTGNDDVYDSAGTLILQMDVVDSFGYIDSDPSSHRYYLGVNPQSPANPAVAGTLDETQRIEPVLFKEPGCYLVVCLRPIHLRDAMIGLVEALP